MQKPCLLANTNKLNVVDKKKYALAILGIFIWNVVDVPAWIFLSILVLLTLYLLISLPTLNKNTCVAFIFLNFDRHS